MVAGLGKCSVNFWDTPWALLGKPEDGITGGAGFSIEVIQARYLLLTQITVLLVLARDQQYTRT